MLTIEMLTDRLYRHFLIVAVCYAILNIEIAYITSVSLLNKQLQVVLCMESIQPSWWVAQAINYIGLKTIGVVDNRLYPISLFKAFGIQFCLVFAFYWRYACSLGFNDCKGQSIAAKENIVTLAFCSHRDFDFFRSHSSV